MSRKLRLYLEVHNYLLCGVCDFKGMKGSTGPALVRSEGVEQESAPTL